MKSFSKLEMKFDKKDNGYCEVKIQNNDFIKTGWIKLDEFSNWINNIVHINSKNQNSLFFEHKTSKNLITAYENNDETELWFLHHSSIRDISAYQKGKFVHKTIFLPNILFKVKISNLKDWDVNFYAFNGVLNLKTNFYAMKLPHFYDDGSLCLGNLKNHKKINSFEKLSDYDKLLDYIFSTKFIHEWTEINEEFTKTLHYINGLAGLKNYIKINNKDITLFNKR